MSTALATSTTTDIMPIIEQMGGLMQLADTLIKSGMLPSSIKSKEAAVAIMLKGREIGCGPMEAFSSINVIQGKPTISPQLMVALSERSGALQDYTIKDTDDMTPQELKGCEHSLTKNHGGTCMVTVTRRGRTPKAASYSMEDAKRNGLAGKDNWKKQPKIMRQWRAVSAAFRVVFADVLAGLYIPEEMGAEVDEAGQIVDAPAEAPVPTVTNTDGWTTEPADDNEMSPPIDDEPDFTLDGPPSNDWIKTAEGIRGHTYFNRAKKQLGDETYYRLLQLHACKHRTDIKTREKATAVCATLRENGVSMKEETPDTDGIDYQPDNLD